MSDERDDELDEILERAHKAELHALETGEGWGELRPTFRVTERILGVNSIMRKELAGTTLGRGAFGIPGDPEVRLNAQIAGLLPPDAVEMRLRPQLVPV